MFGRYRVGKKALIERFLEDIPYGYSQAIDASKPLQIEQISEALNGILPKNIIARSWKELLASFSLIQGRVTIVITD